MEQISFLQGHGGIDPHIGHIDQLFIPDWLTTIPDPAKGQQGLIATFVLLDEVTDRCLAFARIGEHIDDAQLIHLFGIVKLIR